MRLADHKRSKHLAARRIARDARSRRVNDKGAGFGPRTGARRVPPFMASQAGALFMRFIGGGPAF